MRELWVRETAFQGDWYPEEHEHDSSERHARARWGLQSGDAPRARVVRYIPADESPRARLGRWLAVNQHRRFSFAATPDDAVQCALTEGEEYSAVGEGPDEEAAIADALAREQSRRAGPGRSA